MSETLLVSIMVKRLKLKMTLFVYHASSKLVENNKNVRKLFALHDMYNVAGNEPHLDLGLLKIIGLLPSLGQVRLSKS